MELRLTPEERELLLELLEGSHHDLVHEIAQTKYRQFKPVLRTKEKVLEALLSKVAGEFVTD